VSLNPIVLRKIENRGEPKRPYLRKKFWARPHPVWGAAVCWYVWSPLYGWGINYGISCKTLKEAKTIRRFLNGKVNPWSPTNMPFYKVIEFVASGSFAHPTPKEFY